MSEFVARGCVRIVLDGVNAYLVDTGADTLTLVDTGLQILHPRRVLRAIGAFGRAPDDLGDILITHQHIDHAGGLARVAAATGARVHVHPLDAPEIEVGDRSRPGLGRGPATRLIARSARIRPVEAVPVDHYLPDVDGVIDGIGIRSIHTPGHTAGHTAFLWPAHGGVLFVGDAFANWRGSLGHTPSAEDWDLANASIGLIAELDFQAVAFGHGPPIRDQAAVRVRRFAEHVAGTRR